MNGKFLRATACGIAALVITTVVSASNRPNAGDRLVNIYDQQTAAAALVTGFNIVDRLSFNMVYIVHLGQLKAESVLQQLNFLTTPAALMANRNGINVPCPVSGSYTARLTATYLHKLDVEWNSCVFQEYGVTSTLNGPASIVLLDKSFVGPFVGEIRLGAPSRDLVETLTLDYVIDEAPTIHTFNSRVSGLIPVKRETDYLQFTGPFDVHVDGFFDEVNYHLDVNGEPLPTGFRLIADDLHARGAKRVRTSATDMLDDANTEFTSGALILTYRQGETRETRYQTFRGFKVHDVSVHNGGWRRVFELDGDTEYFADSAGSGCLNGGYRFHTTAPLLPDLTYGDPYNVTSGQISVNGSLVARFSESDPRLTMFVGRKVFTLDPTNGNLQYVARCGIW